jgi:hypothetical protein
MKLFCLIIVSFFVTACIFPKRGDEINYASYSDAYEVASLECKTNPQFVNAVFADCLKKMDFKENVFSQDFDSLVSDESDE